MSRVDRGSCEDVHEPEVQAAGESAKERGLLATPSRQDDLVTVLANNKAVAKGEIVIDGDRIAVSISELLKGYTSKTSKTV